MRLMYLKNNFSGVRDIYHNSMRKNKQGNEIEKGWISGPFKNKTIVISSS